MQLVIVFNLLILMCGAESESKDEVDDDSKGDFGADLIGQMRNDANLDLPHDEEYEDLRAELLAYHTALAHFTTATGARRSMMTTPCWRLGGICVNYKLCAGHRFLTQVPGCKDRLNVCCFTWNDYRVKDFRDQGIEGNFPWSTQLEYGGKGVISKADEEITAGSKSRKKKRKPHNLNSTEVVAVIIKAK